MLENKNNYKYNRYVELYNCKIYANGTIFGLLNTKLKPTKQGMVKIKIDNDFVNISVTKLIYYAYHQNEFDIRDTNIVVNKIDEQLPLNVANLKKEYKKNCIQGENNKNSKLKNKQVKEIIDKYIKYKDKSQDNNNPNKKVSYRSLAKEYNVSCGLISAIINGKCRNELNYKLK